MRVKIVEQKLVAEGTSEVAFDLKAQPFTFKAGQYVNVCLFSLTSPDPRGQCREFSIQSSPNEAGIVRVAFRHSESGFKKTMLSLPIGTELELDGPFGLFTISKKRTDPVVLIAGGIGVTPFMSMIRSAAEQKSSLKIILISSNATVERTPFRDALQELEKQNPNFSFKENIGHLTSEFIKEAVKDVSNPLYYLAGPPKMVLDIAQSLKNNGVDEEDILAEEFVGYE